MNQRDIARRISILTVGHLTDGDLLTMLRYYWRRQDLQGMHCVTCALNARQAGTLDETWVA